jgi:hypothetical protein
MKRESRTVDRPHQGDLPAQRHLLLMDLLVHTRAELMELGSRRVCRSSQRCSKRIGRRSVALAISIAVVNSMCPGGATLAH